MRYWGGKVRTAGQIASIIQTIVEQDAGEPIEHFVEPFCGCVSVGKKLAPFLVEHGIEIHASDGSADIILLWEGIKNGTFECPKEPITKELWYRLKEVDTTPSALRAYVGHGYSFSGLFFGAYTDSYKGDRLYKSLMRDKPLLEQMTFRHCDYRKALDGIKGRCVIFIDPPYAGSTFKFGSQFHFDIDQFYDTVRKWAAAGNICFIAEHAFPFGTVMFEKKSFSSTRHEKFYVDRLYLVDKNQTTVTEEEEENERRATGATQDA